MINVGRRYIYMCRHNPFFRGRLLSVINNLIQTFSTRTLFLGGFFLQIEESGSPQILILPSAESSVVHKILLIKTFPKVFSLTFCGNGVNPDQIFHLD